MTIAEVLQKGIAAHQAGQYQEADKFYTAILQAQPENPDANHNMGVLAVDLGKTQQALGFFKAALDANSSPEQFWLSYINTLLKLNRLEEARTALDQAMELGVKDNNFPQLAQKLSAMEEKKRNTNADINPSQEELERIVSLYNSGQLEEVLLQANRMLDEHPNSAILYNILGAASAEAGLFEAATNNYKQAIRIKPDYAEAYSNMGNCLRVIGNYEASINSCRQALEINPNFAEAHNNLGNSLRELGDLEAAIDSYIKALKISPDYAEAHNNLGVAQQEKGNLKTAIGSYKQALEIRPNYADAQYNIGVILQEMGDLDDAIASYQQAIKIRPNNADAHNNLGVTLQEKGDLEAAIESFKEALKVRPDHTDSFVNMRSIEVQTTQLPEGPDAAHFRVAESLQQTLARNPEYQIYQSISCFIGGDLDSSKEHIERFRNLTADAQIEKLSNKKQLFCNAYSNFIEELIARSTYSDNRNCKTIYHLGESHCLSYAHCTLRKDGESYVIVPKITFGAKAHHFSVPEENVYKAITRHNLDTLPSRSQVFISMGEIDCRISEGIILASVKTKKNIDEIIEQTVQGYVSWYLAKNSENLHEFFFFNVPAPVYLEDYPTDSNNEAAEVVSRFNSRLGKKLAESDTNMIDVYEHTKDSKGFSNGLYHCDPRHLDSRILGAIQEQWCA